MTDPGDVVHLPVPRSALSGMHRVLLKAYDGTDWRREARANGVPGVPPRWLDEVLTSIAQLAPSVPRQDVPRVASARSAQSRFSREYTANTAAQVLGVTSRAVRALAGRGTMPATRASDQWRSWRLDADAVDARARRLGRRPPPRLAAEPPNRSSR